MSDTPQPPTKKKRVCKLPPGPGRPKGSQNKVTVEIKNFAHRFVNDEAYLKKLRVRVNEGTAPHMETLMWHYAYGKPKDEDEDKLDKNVTILIVQHTASEQVKTVMVNTPLKELP